MITYQSIAVTIATKMEKNEKHAKIFFVSVAQNMLHVRTNVSDVVLEREVCRV